MLSDKLERWAKIARDYKESKQWKCKCGKINNAGTNKCQICGSWRGSK